MSLKYEPHQEPVEAVGITSGKLDVASVPSSLNEPNGEANSGKRGTPQPS